MAKVFLRVYNRELESMIEGGQLDEAIAHCQYILKTFPMHVDTYRLLGKAFLEARRYADAADIFQRVLMAVPDDFVSHVGMSIIRDDENKIDDAIWHMERAFEVQPSNSAIQGELRRLRGRRDGVEPSKIRLSRDALANMYSQGELFDQAIAEIRSVLAENTNRPDLQVMLARAYFRSDQKVEAAEIAATLLKKYPYCMDSLRVLVDVLPGTARAENVQIYKQRLHNLDPYSSFTVNSVFASDQVADSSVILERLEYRSGLTTISSQPDWASSLGIKLNNDEKPAKDTPPAWMLTAETSEQLPPSTLEPSASSVAKAPAAEAESVLDWMRSAGWQESNHIEQVGSTDSGESLSDEPIEKADIPDWLKSMAPTGATEEVAPEPDKPAEPQPARAADVPDWLKSISPAEAAGEMKAEAQQPVEPQQIPVEPLVANADEVPDWLKSISPDEAAGEVHAKAQEPFESQQAPVEPPPASSGGVPDWFKTLAPAKTIEVVSAEATQLLVEPQTEGVDATPDWLKPLTPPEASEEAHIEATPPPIESQTEVVDATPDWLKSMAPAEKVGGPNVVSESASIEPSKVESEPGSSTAGMSSANVEAFPDWLTGIGVRADAAALNTKAMEQPLANLPVSELPVPPEPATQTPVKPPIPPAGTSGETVQPAGEVKPLNIGDDAFSWLESLAAKQGARSEELLTNPEERSGEMPDWLRKIGDKPADAPVPAVQETVPTPPETFPLESLSGFDAAPVSKGAHPLDEVLQVYKENPSSEAPSELAAQPVNQQTEGEDDTLAWLEQMAADQGLKSEEPLADPVADLETTPEWIQKMQEEQSAVPATEEKIPAIPERAPAEEDISITSWLSKLDVDETLGKKSGEISTDAAPATTADELPDWLNDLQKHDTSVEAPKADNDLPEWLRHPIPSDALEPVPPAPVIDSNPDQELPAWVDENISITGQAVPTMPEEWLPAETKEDGTPDSLPQASPTSVAETPPLDDSKKEADITQAVDVESVSVPVPTTKAIPFGETLAPAETTPIPDQEPVRAPTLNQTDILSHFPVLDKDTELLLSAQNVLDQNSLDDAMKKYTKLIKKGRLLDEVIHDLREAIYRYPVDVIVWQTLGDAYMRANRLQDALDAYTKAEELLR